MADKKIISHILDEERNWTPADRIKPRYNEPVVVRLYNPNVIYQETDTEIYPAEDIKIARYMKRYGAEGGTWYIEPPFPRYEYGPLTNKDSLAEGTIVTHWAKPDDGELEAWRNKFTQINLFKKLVLEVDEEHEEDVYRALIFGASFIQNIARRDGETDPEVMRLATILYDLQYVLDNHKSINLSDEEYEALIRERANKEPEDKDDES